MNNIEKTYNDLFFKGKNEKENAQKLLNYVENDLKIDEIIPIIENEEIYHYFFGTTPYCDLNNEDKEKVIDYFIEFIVSTCNELININS